MQAPFCFLVSGRRSLFLAHTFPVGQTGCRVSSPPSERQRGPVAGRSIEDQPRWEGLERPRLPSLKMAAQGSRLVPTGGARVYATYAALRSGGRVHRGKGTRGLRPSLKSWAPRLPLTSSSPLLDSGGEDGASHRRYRQRGPAGGPGWPRPFGFPASGGAAAEKAAHELGTAHQSNHGLSQAREWRG